MNPAKLKEPNTQERRFEEVVKAAGLAAVLVLVYRSPRTSIIWPEPDPTAISEEE